MDLYTIYIKSESTTCLAFFVSIYITIYWEPCMNKLIYIFDGAEIQYMFVFHSSYLNAFNTIMHSKFK